MMVVEDCGEIPVCEYEQESPSSCPRPRHRVPDGRQGAESAFDKGLRVPVRPCVTVVQDMSVDECCRLMENIKSDGFPSSMRMAIFAELSPRRIWRVTMTRAIRVRL